MSDLRFAMRSPRQRMPAMQRVIVGIAAAAWFGFGLVQASDGLYVRRLAAQQEDVNRVRARPIAATVRSLAAPVPYAREVYDPRPLRNGRKPKVIIDPDGRGAVVGAALGRRGFALYRAGRAPAVIAPLRFNAEDAQVADVDGDGAPDIVIGGLDGYTAVLHNPLHSRCADVYRCPWPMTIVDARHLSHDVVTGDVNGDGRIDIVTEAGIYFNFNRTKGARPARWRFVGRDVIRRDGEGTSLIDAEHDGILDVIAPYRSGTMLARFVNPLHHGGDPYRDVWAIDVIDANPPFTGNMTTAAVDVDGDGRTDVLLAPMYGGGGLSWYRAPATPGGAWHRRMIDKSINYVHQGSLQIADMNGNGRPDIVFAEQDQSPTHRVGVFYNVGSVDERRWRLQIIGLRGGHNIKVGTLAGDRRPSILSARHGYLGGPNPLVVFRNRLSASRVPARRAP